MDESAGWTLEELVQRVALVLTGSARAGDYPGAPNGRVRELPDQRMVRWYASTGIVDRPFGGRGRGARYGVRHLRQLVAVKHLQAQGLPLAEIQARLAGVSDAELGRLVPLPAEALAPGQAVPEQAVPAPAAPDPAVPDPAVPDPVAPALAVPERAIRRFAGLELAPGALLVLPEPPGPDDVVALAEAAQPLVDALIRRGLIPRSAVPAEPTEGASR